MENQKALVIGAGVGGIATAARLARHGYTVTVAEQRERAGGRCSHLCCAAGQQVLKVRFFDLGTGDIGLT